MATHLLRSLAPPLRRSLPFAAWCVAAALALSYGPAVFGAGAHGLVPAEHRASPGLLVVLHRRSAADESWARIADTLGPRLSGHLPSAPPPGEARVWLDAHLLYWVADQPALARRFEPPALRAAIASIHARMASPLFSVGGEDIRRDPLGLADLSGMHAPPQLTVTSSGDLMSADGNTLLIQLQTTMTPETAAASVSAQLHSQFSSDSPGVADVADIEVRAFVLGEESSHSPQPVRWIIANLALLAFVLALGLRRLRASAAVIAVLAVGAPLVLFIAGPLVLALLGVAAALGLRPLTRTAWLQISVALAPLLLLPYPAWQHEALVWPLATLVLALGVGVVLPGLQRLLRARPPEPPATVTPLPRTAALVACTAVLVGGVWSIGQVPTTSVVADTPPALVGLRDTARLAWVHSRGDTPPDALAAAARDARDVAAALPGARLDGPAMFVLDDDILAARGAALATLDLPGRLEFLRAALAEQGLRPDAFGEFFRALDPSHQPSPAAALASPLGPWLQTQLRQDDAGSFAVTTVHLPDTLPDTLPAQLRGPAVFAHRVQQDFTGHLVLALVASAWLSAFLTWLSTRRLALALTAALVGAAAQISALAAVAAIHGEISPTLLPALLIVGATTAVACDPAHPRSALASTCLAIPGLVLLTDPTWSTTGLVLALGSAIGGLLATHVAPTLRALFGHEARP